LHGEQRITPIDIAVCLKHLPLNTSRATFQIRELSDYERKRG